ncbi:MAG TPA: acetyl-CoA carboxylase biotin carboxyl carrier protein subunit [Methanomicrobia archaeon]|nr:acetyl-CoA carboxylase biotin carboxyl carrier protein subunit [Methanomicrobia archaeon]
MLDLESLIAILEACKKNKIAELIVRKDSVEIRTVSPSGGAAPAAAAPQPQVSLPAEEEAEEEAAAPAKPAEPAASTNVIQLTAPTPGVAYVHPGTTVDREPLPKEGDVVEAGQVVGLVEAMKLFNEVTAPKKAKLSKILVENEEIVKTGDVLIELEPL